MDLLENVATGCRSVDDTLDGGLPAGSISLIYGEAETGKTTLAMQCAVNCANRNSKTLYVDCDDTFSAQRLSQVASKQFKQIAELIILMKPKDFREQAAIIDQMTDYVTMNFGLIVFDTFTSLYRLRVAESPSRTFELNRELNRQLAVLAQTARTQKIAVLTTSQVHNVLSDMPVSVEPVATRVLKFWADIVIALKPTANPQMIEMMLTKNPTKAAAKTCTLRMGATGLRECMSR
jgi:DNA repair protein RadB